MDSQRSLSINKSIKTIGKMADKILNRFGAHSIAIVVCCHSKHNSNEPEEIITGFADKDHFLVPFLKKAINESETEEPTRVI